MENKRLIESTKRVYKSFPLPFYKQTLEFLNKNKNILTCVDDDKYNLTAIQFEIGLNPDKYTISISDHHLNIKNSLTRKLLLTSHAKICLLSGICFNDSDTFEAYCIAEEKMSTLVETLKGYNLYVTITDSSLKDIKGAFYECTEKRDNAGLLFGIESIRLFHHQRIDSMCHYYRSKNKYMKESFEVTQKYRKFLSTIDWIERQRYLVFSGMVLFAAGTTYTRDIDLMMIAFDRKQEWFNKQSKIYDNQKIIDYMVLLDDGYWHQPKNVILEYQKKWLTYDLPMLAGARDILQVAGDPTYHFIYYGIKFVSMDITIQRLAKRGRPTSYVDLWMVSNKNEVSIPPDLCIPSSAVRRGEVTVYDENKIEKIYYTVKHYFKLWHNMNMNIKDLKEWVDKCDSGFAKYRGKVKVDDKMQPIKKFHTELKSRYISKWCNGCDHLLDVGAGRLRDLEFWEKANVKKVTAIEPSLVSVKKGIARIKRQKPKIKIDLLHGIGDGIWDQGLAALSNKNRFKEVFSKIKYFDCITFMFTIHYMSNRYDILIPNLVKYSRKGSKVIILCMDGRYIHQKILKDKNHKIEIYEDDIIDEPELLFSLEPSYPIYDETQELGDVLVYFQGTYGLENKIKEPLVDINELVSIMKKNSFDLVEKKKLIDINIEEKKLLTKQMEKISDLYIGLVFQKK